MIHGTSHTVPHLALCSLACWSLEKCPPGLCTTSSLVLVRSRSIVKKNPKGLEISSGLEIHWSSTGFRKLALQTQTDVRTRADVHKGYQIYLHNIYSSDMHVKG